MRRLWRLLFGPKPARQPVRDPHDSGVEWTYRPPGLRNTDSLGLSAAIQWRFRHQGEWSELIGSFRPTPQRVRLWGSLLPPEV